MLYSFFHLLFHRFQLFLSFISINPFLKLISKCFFFPLEISIYVTELFDLCYDERDKLEFSDFVVNVGGLVIDGIKSRTLCEKVFQQKNTNGFGLFAIFTVAEAFLALSLFTLT